MTALRFTQNLLVAFSTHYPSSFHKAYLINVPTFFVRVWALISKVLPDSVNAKIELSADAAVLQGVLTPEAMRFVESSDWELNHAPHAAPAQK